MNKENIASNPYISCVEAYYLAWLSQYTDIRKLYCSSFIELGEVIDDFIAGAKYAAYDKIPRLQDWGEELGITNHTRRVRFTCDTEDELTLMRVRPLFCKSILAPWRNDHYIAVVKNKHGYDYFNHYPLSCGVLTPGERVAAYDGVTIIYRYTGKWNDKMYEECKQIELGSIRNTVDSPRTDKIFGTELRDALGILRAARERTYRWLQYEGKEISALKEQIRCLNLFYFKVSTDIQRGKSGENYTAHWDKILHLEREWRKKI